MNYAGRQPRRSVTSAFDTSRNKCTGPWYAVIKHPRSYARWIRSSWICWLKILSEWHNQEDGTSKRKHSVANIFTGRRMVNVASVGVPVIARNRSNCSRFLLTACAGLNYTIDRLPNPCNELFNQIISLLLSWGRWKNDNPYFRYEGIRRERERQRCWICSQVFIEI